MIEVNIDRHDCIKVNTPIGTVYISHVLNPSSGNGEVVRLYSELGQMIIYPQGANSIEIKVPNCG